MTKLEKFKNRILYGSVDKSFYYENEAILEKYNYGIVRTITKVALFINVVFSVLCILTNFKSLISIMYFSYTAVFAGLFVIARLVLSNRLSSVRTMYYALFTLAFSQSLITSTVFSPNSRMVIVLLVIVVMPVLYIEPPIYSYLSVIVASLITCIVDINVKSAPDSVLLFDDMTALAVCIMTAIPFLTVIREKDIANIKARKYFEAKSEIDGLTEVYNRASSELMIKEHLEQYNEHGALFILDIDGFKSINDRYGHMAGDAVLKELGKTLKNTFRQSDIVGRLGGDEFMIFMKNVSNCDDVKAKAELLMNNIGALSKDNDVMCFTCSVGVACRTKTDDFDTLYSLADAALYRVKNECKGKYIINEK